MNRTCPSINGRSLKITCTLTYIILVFIKGSQMHTDPDFMGAWNLLLTGRKWWVVLPYQVSLDLCQLFWYLGCPNKRGN